MPEKIHIDLIIFDLDGTIAETRQDIADAANYMLGRLNLPHKPEEVITSYVGNGIKKLIERCLPDASSKVREKAFDHFVEYYGNHLTDNTYLYPGMIDFLEKASTKKMAVLSNKAEDFTKKIIQDLGVEKYFAIVMGSNQQFPKKPEPDSIDHIVKTLECTKRKTIIIGDTKNDIIAGQAAGIYTCAVSYGFRNKERLQKYNSDFMIDSIDELLHIIFLD
jgi:phosphoglycolate phosphatase